MRPGRDFKFSKYLGLLPLAWAIGAGPAQADPIYSLETLIDIPANTALNPTGTFSSFDISFFDANTQLDYVSDRNNAGVDIFSAATNSFVGRVPGFVGFTGSTSTSGPDGVLTVNLPGQHQLWAGDGNTTLKGFDIPAGYSPLGGTPVNTGGTHRVDEMSFDPKDNLLLVANNADTPPFATLVNAKTSAIVGKITFNGSNNTPNAMGGIEQSVWDPNTQKFYLSVPEVNGTGAGAIAEISATGQVVNTYNLGAFGISSCSPAGLARGAGSRLMIGCGNAGTQAILFDPAANGGKGALIKTFPQVSGSDEVWYDPATGRFFVTGGNNPNGPVVAVIDDATASFLENIPTVPGNAHSVAVDPVSGEVFIPFPAGNALCASGCMAVFGTTPVSTPEPGTFPLTLLAMAGLGLALRPRWCAEKGKQEEE